MRLTPGGWCIMSQRMEKKNRIAEAFKENFNLLGLAGAAALSAATLNPIPLLIGVVVEAAYLIFVPDSKWFDSRLEARFDAEVLAHRNKLKNEVFPRIAAGIKERFVRLEGVRAQVGSEETFSTEHWFRQVLRKLDYLLEKFLLFARKDAEFRTHLKRVYEETVEPPRPRDVRRRGARGQEYDLTEDATPPTGDRWVTATVTAIQNHFDEELDSVRRERASEEDYNTQAILDKRIEVISSRHEQVGRIGKILTNLGHQMNLLEDSFGLINDQLRARSPEQVLADIDGLVYQTDAMTKMLDEMSSLGL
jgi:hypothetical protein